MRSVLIRLAAASRDLIMVAVGLLLLSAPPPSVDQFSPSNLMALVWAAALVAGGLVSGYGVLARKPLAEVVGCASVGGGFFIWFLAAITRDDRTETTVAVALVMLAGAVGQAYRVAAAPHVAAALALAEGEVGR